MSSASADHRTIHALSSGRGRAGVAVIRISGPAAGAVLDRMAPPRPRPRVAAFRTIRHPATGEPLDQALVLYFAGPRSETGEDMAELQVHGGPAVVAAVLDALSGIGGCRLAEPGEFARRAFENGKLDLTAAEGLADLVDAETEAQRRQALRQAGGELARLYDGWRSRLLDAMATAEAAIDFSDEADVGAAATAEGSRIVNALAGEIADHLARGRRGEIVRDGFRVAIVGPPNAGKSSLLNALARRDAAIVSDEPGTTRDVVEVRLDLDGLAVVVADTAGLRDTAGAVEQEGMRRARAAAAAADLVIWLVDAASPVWPPAADLPGLDGRLLVVLNKCDLSAAQGLQPPSGVQEGPRVSARDGTGIDALTDHLSALAAAATAVDREAPVLSRARHREHLAACLEALNRFSSGDSADVELRAEDLRRAAHELGRLTGRVDVEDVLDRVFGRFCIGK